MSLANARLARRLALRWTGPASWRDAGWLALLGAGLRLLSVLWASGRFPPAADGEFYDVVARRIADGHGYTWLWPDGAVSYAAHYPVGYPAIMGGIYAVFGANPTWAMLLNAALGSLAVMACYWLAAQPYGRRGGLLAGGLAAVHPGLVLYTPALMTEGITAALYAIAAWLALAAGRTHRIGLCVALGVLLGVTTLVRPQSVVLVPAFGAAAAWAGHRTSVTGKGSVRGSWWLRSLLVTAVALCVCLPWTVRNCQRMGRCVFVSANGGWNLLIGTASEANGAWISLEDMGVPAPCREVFEEAAKDACFGQAAVERIRSAPGEWLSLVPKKWSATFDYPAAPAAYFRMANPAEFGHAAKQVLVAVETAWYRLLTLLGLIGLWRLPGAFSKFRLVALVGGAASLLSPHAWPAVLALLAAALSAWRELLRLGPVALAVLLLAATVLIHAVFFGAGRYALVCGYLAGVLATTLFHRELDRVRV